MKTNGWFSLAMTLLWLCAYGQQQQQSGPPQLVPDSGGPAGKPQAWAHVVHGAFPCAVRGQVKISAAGGVSVRGASRDDCGYRIRQVVRGATEAEARKGIIEFGVRARMIAETAIFTLAPARESRASAIDLEVWVPRTVREVQIQTRAGNVQAHDVDGSVSVDSGGGPIDLDRIGGSAVAETAGGKIHIGRVHGMVRCFSGGGYIRVDYAGGEAWVDTAGGEISVGQVMGPLHVTTAGGNIGVDRAGGAVWAKSMSGLIEIQSAGGAVTAVAMGGSIEIGSARGGANCEAGSGAIRVKTSDGPLRLSTAVGNVLVQVVGGKGFADSFVNSDSGDVTVMIPANLPVSIEAWNESPGYRGMIVSEFPEVRVVQAGGGMQPVKAMGALNGGGPVLRVSTGRGSLYLLRQK